MQSNALIAIITLLGVYAFLITEKVNKVIVVGTGALLLMLLQIFKTATESSQQVGLQYIAHNLDMLGFVLGMMILVGIVKDSEFFEAIAIWLVKSVKGKPIPLLIVLGIFTLITTIILPNIIAVLIVTPILLILIREFKFPALPYFLVMLTMANVGGATTPISDPTTYYMAKRVGLGFMEVVYNSGLLVFVLAVISMLYALILFWKPLRRLKVKEKDIEKFNPKLAIKDRKLLFIGTPLLFFTLGLMIFKENINASTGWGLDDATIALSAAILAMIIFKVTIEKVFSDLVDWQILFFFMGLFVVVGALEHTGVVALLGQWLVSITHGELALLLFMIAVGSGALSTFIDNVPYNIAMIAAIQAMEKSGVVVYPLWWALNLGTSLGGAGSPIGAACNVVALGQADKENVHINFMKYLAYGFPLVIINGLATFFVLYLRYNVFK